MFPLRAAVDAEVVVVLLASVARLTCDPRLALTLAVIITLKVLRSWQHTQHQSYYYILVVQLMHRSAKFQTPPNALDLL